MIEITPKYNITITEHILQDFPKDLMSLQLYLSKKYKYTVNTKETFFKLNTDIEHFCYMLYKQGKIQKNFQSELFEFLKSIVKVQN